MKCVLFPERELLSVSLSAHQHRRRQQSCLHCGRCPFFDLWDHPYLTSAHFCPPPHIANISLHHKLHATLHVLWLKRTSSKAVLFEGRHSSTKRALKRPQKAAALPPSRWHRSSPPARSRSPAHSLFARSKDAVE